MKDSKEGRCMKSKRKTENNVYLHRWSWKGRDFSLKLCTCESMGQALALSRFRAARTGDTCVVRGAADIARPTVLLLVIECNGSGK